MIRRIGVCRSSTGAAGRRAAPKGSEEAPTSSPPPTPAAVTPEQARAIAKEAYIYGFPMVDNYRVQYAYFVNKQDPEYKGGWNEIHNTARVYTPEDKAIQTPNSDTPYSAVGADLRAEPLVLTVPPIEQDRYYSLQFVDALHLQLRLRRQPHHRQRRREIPSRRAELEGRQARGRQRGHPLRHRPGVRAVPHPAVRPVRHRQGQEDPGRLPGHAAVGLSEPAAAGARACRSTSCRR